MEHQSQFNMEPTKVICPHCGHKNCFEESRGIPTVEGDSEQLVTSWMCLDCGYTTTSLNIEGSDVVAQSEATSPNLMIDLRWVDPNTNLVWYPLVLNFPSFGIIFPDGTNKYDWNWRAGLAVPVPEQEAENYPIPGQPGAFYNKRIDMENSKLFAPADFYNACKYLGFIKE